MANSVGTLRGGRQVLPSLDNRYELLKGWLAEVLAVREFELRPASGDASFRRYFRIHAAGSTYVVMDAPPERENTARYVEVATRFHRLGLNVPEILEQDLSRGFLLISDLGARQYLAELNMQTADTLYGDAIRSLVLLQSCSVAEPEFLAPYDEPLLRRELEIFREWYLVRHLGLRLDSAQNAMIDDVFDVLTHSALNQPAVWVHRDYHSRNLMVTPTQNPGILDFQDAVHGPVTYDLVSLLRDCYIAWPDADVQRWIGDYLAQASAAGIPVNDDAGFRRSFDLMGMQRHLKATGIFARLLHRDGKAGYLDDIPRTLGYVLRAGSNYPELSAFRQWLAQIPTPDVIQR